MTVLLTDFLKEQRHIFGVCPKCGEVQRFTDIHISYVTRYVPDWLDGLELEQERLDRQSANLLSKKEEIRNASLERAKRKILPTKLKAVSPLFARVGVSPQDIRTIFHPIDYVCFDGLYSKDRLKQVLFLDRPPATLAERLIQSSLRRAIHREAFDWATVRVDDEGNVSRE